MATRRHTTDGRTQAARPERSCIACRALLPKSTLFRVVRTPAQAIVADMTGRAPGRGAYVCSRRCFEQARKARRFGRALRAPVREDELDAIAETLALWEKKQNRE